MVLSFCPSQTAYTTGTTKNETVLSFWDFDKVSLRPDFVAADSYLPKSQVTASLKTTINTMFFEMGTNKHIFSKVYS